VQLLDPFGGLGGTLANLVQTVVIQSDTSIRIHQLRGGRR